MTQGNNNTFDLDALLRERSLEPEPVKLGGRVYKIRTDLTGQEVKDFLALMRSGHDEQAFTILVGTAAERTALYKALRSREKDEPVELPVGKAAEALNAAIDKLPRVHQATASAAILRASKALADFAAPDSELAERFNSQGESQAS